MPDLFGGNQTGASVQQPVHRHVESVIRPEVKYVERPQRQITEKAKAEGMMNEEQMEAYKAFLAAKAYQSYVIQRRASKNITATLKRCV